VGEERKEARDGDKKGALSISNDRDSLELRVVLTFQGVVRGARRERRKEGRKEGRSLGTMRSTPELLVSSHSVAHSKVLQCVE